MKNDSKYVYMLMLLRHKELSEIDIYNKVKPPERPEYVLSALKTFRAAGEEYIDAAIKSLKGETKNECF